MIGYSKIERIFIPANPRIPNIRIVTKHSNDLDNMRICVVMDTWDRTSRLPQVIILIIVLLVLLLFIIMIGSLESYIGQMW